MLEPKIIEAYDVSNISGADNVSAMVAFENGRPSGVKKFKIRTVEGSDDYGSMKETLHRRFRNAAEEEEKIKAGTLLLKDAKFLPYPDLILIDGGKGHLFAALEILSQMEIDIPTFGMVKDDRHRTRAIIAEEGEISLSSSLGVLNLITRIQDEVHRSAITYHRKLHKNTSLGSELDSIKGIGEARKNALLSHFKSIEAIKKVDIDELCAVKGMTKSAAEAVIDYFSGK